MAFNKSPSTWIADWSENGTNITVLIASFTELTADEADGSTGDIRKIMFAVCEQIYNEFNETAVADRPTKMTVYRNTSTNDTTGVTTKTYQFRFEIGISGQEVESE